MNYISVFDVFAKRIFISLLNKLEEALMSHCRFCSRITFVIGFVVAMFFMVTGCGKRQKSPQAAPSPSQETPKSQDQGRSVPTAAPTPANNQRQTTPTTDVTFMNWVVTYSGESTNILKNETSWLIRPGLSIKSNEKEPPVSVFLQAEEGKCGDLQKLIDGITPKTRFVVSDTVSATLASMHTRFDGNINSNSYAFISDNVVNDNSTCLLLIFYNGTQTDTKIGFNEQNEEIGRFEMENIIKTARHL